MMRCMMLLRIFWLTALCLPSMLCDPIDASESCPFSTGSDFHKGPLPSEYSGGLKEFSVVYTDRALNHMSAPFQKVMIDLHDILTEAYQAYKAVIIPGSGTYAMEAIARQLDTGNSLVIRNGYFSYRWSDIFEQSKMSPPEVEKASPVSEDDQPHFAPPTIESVIAKIEELKPTVVFAPHVETSTGIILPDEYIQAVAAAVHRAGGLFVLDCVASGTVWVDMKSSGVDVIVSAPQKGWSGPACAGLLMLSERATAAVLSTTSSSMVLNVQKWYNVMKSYLDGGFMYYTTMPTDCLALFRDVAQQTKDYGFAKIKADFQKMGSDIRAMMESKGLKSVAAAGYQAPGVIVSYTNDATIAAKFKKAGFQIAVGVPFMIDEPAGLQTFRIGLFGLDKVSNPEATLATLEAGLDQALAAA